MENEIPKDIYISFARLIYPQIIAFYETQEGQNIRNELIKQNSDNSNGEG